MSQVSNSKSPSKFEYFLTETNLAVTFRLSDQKSQSSNMLNFSLSKISLKA
uniref:Uncharacterized protein n=1 Tax=Rhizophora mucronata TaxID=61149 RepID=A0A2P2Q9B6_RHIMU